MIGRGHHRQKIRAFGVEKMLPVVDANIVTRQRSIQDARRFRRSVSQKPVERSFEMGIHDATLAVHVWKLNAGALTKASAERKALSFEVGKYDREKSAEYKDFPLNVRSFSFKPQTSTLNADRILAQLLCVSLPCNRLPQPPDDASDFGRHSV